MSFSIPTPQAPASDPGPARPSVLGAAPLACWVLAVVATGAGCGGAPAPTGGSQLDPLAAAEADLAAAEAKLGPRFGPKPVDAAPQAGQGAVGLGEPTHEMAQPSPHPQARSEVPGVEPEDTNAYSCESACDALSAMRKAADRICELAPGERCDAARARVADAEKRVTEACSECEG